MINLRNNYASTVYAYNAVLMESRGKNLFWGVLLLGCDVAELVVQSLSVLLLLHPVDAHQPVLGGERLLQVLQTNVLVADLCVSCPVKSRRCAEVQLQKRRLALSKPQGFIYMCITTLSEWYNSDSSKISPCFQPVPQHNYKTLVYTPNELKGINTHLHFPKAVVRHLVHQAVEQRWRAGLVHSKLSLRCEVITFLQKNSKIAVWGLVFDTCNCRTNCQCSQIIPVH